MRWKVKEYVKGDKRIITKFLFFPKLINEEARWLEFATFEQILTTESWELTVWEDLRWINNEKINE